MFSLRNFFVIFFIVLLSGCASNDLKQTGNETSKSFLGDTALPVSYPIYGKLEKTNQVYRFTQITDDKKAIYSSEPWVMLNNMNPMWNTEKEAGCYHGALNTTINCETVDKTLFRDFEINIGQTTLMTVSSFGIGALSPKGAVVFNKDLYNKALDEAVTFLEKEINLKQSILSYDSIRSEMDKRYADAKRKQQELIDNALISVTVNDQSGLYRNNINFDRYVHILPGLTKGAPDYYHSPIGESASKELEGIIFSASEWLSERKKHWLSVTSNFNVICSKKGANDVSFELSCPKNITVKNDKLSFGVDAKVLALDFKNILPTTYKTSNNEISLNFKDGKINISNKTNKFLKVDSFSFYHNHKIASKYALNRELPPSSDIYLFNLDSMSGLISWDDISFDSLTLNKANNKKLEYGFAIKYRVVDSNLEKTLYETKWYRLSDLVLST